MDMDEKTNRSFETALNSLEPLWAAGYDAGVSRWVDLPEATLKTCMLQTVGRLGGETHLIYRSCEFPYAYTNAQACRLAHALLAVGLRKGDSVCIMLGDTPELVVSYMACYKIGCIAVGLNPRSTADEIAERLRDSVASVMIAPQVVAGATLVGAAARGIEVRLLVAVDDAAGTKCDGEEGAFASAAGACGACSDAIVLWEAFLGAASDEEPEADIAPDDVATLIYTGGTTGVSKGCPLTNRMLIWAQYFFFSFMRPLLGDSRNMTSLLTSPMTHAYGMNFGINWGIVVGGTVVIADALDGASIACLIERYRVSVWGAVPVLLNELSGNAQAAQCDLSSLSVVVVSCTASSLDGVKRFGRFCASATVIEDYGMTETSGPVTLTPVLKAASEGSVGVPVENTDVLVVDRESGTKPVPIGERGEIVFRGPQIIKQYWNAPQETERALRGEWIHSGDVGYFDERGCLYVVDRIKDIIDVGGFSVFPREIDTVISTHPAVVDSCTVGVRDERSGERPKSFVVLAEGANATAEEIVEYCHRRIIAYKCPKYVEFVDKIPLTVMGKPNKRELRQREARKAALAGVWISSKPTG